jgi:hypothetical protein
MNAQLARECPHAGEEFSGFYFSDSDLIFDLSRDLLSQRDGAFLADPDFHDLGACECLEL